MSQCLTLGLVGLVGLVGSVEAVVTREDDVARSPLEEVTDGRRLREAAEHTQQLQQRVGRRGHLLRVRVRVRGRVRGSCA